MAKGRQVPADSDWLGGLARFLSAVGVEAGAAEETLRRLRAAGATEAGLRAAATDEGLRGMGIALGPRSATRGR